MACQFLDRLDGQKIISILIVLLGLMAFSNSKLSVTQIISSHIKTLRNYSSKRTSIKDLLTFLILPVLIGFTLERSFYLSDKFSSSILTVFSILTGLLFNFLVLIIDACSKQKQRTVKNNINELRKLNLIKETFSNVSFSILIAIIIICMTLLLELVSSIALLSSGLLMIILSLAIIFILTMLMVLKRMFVILNKDFDASEK